MNFLMLAISITLNSVHASAPIVEHEMWIQSQIQQVVEGCEKKNFSEVVESIRKLEKAYRYRIDEISDVELKKLKSDSLLLDVGRVLFPKELPRGVAMRGIFLLCEERNQSVLRSKTKVERSHLIAEFKECLDENYRIEMPKLASDLIDCYQKSK